MPSRLSVKTKNILIKNGIAFTVLFFVLTLLFWAIHNTFMSSGLIFLVTVSFLLALTSFALRFLVYPYFFYNEEEVLEKSEIFSGEVNIKDFSLRGGYVNLFNMKNSYLSLVQRFKKYYYNEFPVLPDNVNTSISEDIIKQSFSESLFTEKEESHSESENFEELKEGFKAEKEVLEEGMDDIEREKAEIEESIAFQKDYIDSVKEEKNKVNNFLHEQKKDLANLLIQKEKEERQLRDLAVIEAKVIKNLNRERKDLKKVLASSKRELEAINKKRRETISGIYRNRNEAERKADLIKQIQQRRMALASIKKEKLQALNS